MHIYIYIYIYIPVYVSLVLVYFDLFVTNNFLDFQNCINVRPCTVTRYHVYTLVLDEQLQVWDFR